MAPSTGWDRLVQSLEPASSDLDWCEPNYAVSSQITEFYNTVTNVLYIVLPPVMMYMFRHYSRYVSPSCHLVLLLLMVVGAGSAYFHSTLSLAGQLIDELAILWVVAAVIAFWLPRHLLPPYLAKNKNCFYVVVTTTTVTITCLGCFYSALNNIFLMFSIIPIATIVCNEIKSCQEPRARKLGTRCCLLWLVAVTCWISDRTMCSFWISVKFPYLHSIWHCVIIFASHEVILFLAYADAGREHKRLGPELLVWPPDQETFGIMYMSFKSPLPTTVNGIKTQ